jgi:uncharacterized protein (TIGR02679 family)
MTSPSPGLRDWAGLPGPAVLLSAVRRRARLGQATESGRLTALALTPEQRREVGLVLGSDWALSSKPVRLQDLAASLAEHDLTVRDLLEALCGPVSLDRDIRLQAVEAADDERSAAIAELTRAGVPREAAIEWLETDPMLPPAGDGDLVGTVWEVAAIWSSLPGSGVTRLAQFAGLHLGNAHALDADQVLGRLVARLAADVRGLERPTRGGKLWRRAWASVGILCDEVSSRVLVLNLPLVGRAHCVGVCEVSRGEPVWLTLRSLRGEWQSKPATVFVCENPTVIETAADALGYECPPMVCTEGLAHTATLDLIAGLAEAGCRLRVRADFDRAGLVVMNQLLTAAPNAEPWRFDAPTYADLTGLPLAPSADLDEVLRTPVHEEVLLDTLLSDLRAAKEGTDAS